MAGKVPFSDLSATSQDPNTGSSSSSYELFPQIPELEYMGNIRPVTRNWSEQSGGASSDLNSYQQMQEQYKCSIDQCLNELQSIKRKRESTFIQMRKIIRDKVETMMKAVRQSFDHMYIEGTKKLNLKCEEIDRVFSRVDKMLEDESIDVPVECNREESITNQNFLNKMLEEKQKIQSEVEALIQQLNNKRESEEQLYMEFKEDVQQKVQTGISRIERSLEFQADYQARTVEEKIIELRRALANLMHLSKFS